MSADMSAHHNHPFYADAIELDVTFDRSSGMSESREMLLGRLSGWLLDDRGLKNEAIPVGDLARRDLIRLLLTVRDPRPIPPDVQALLDALFAEEARGRAVVTVEDIQADRGVGMLVAGTRLKVWRGDITTLAVDGVVNAANRDLLGCFRPAHACIDNAIHTAAGPRPRKDCAASSSRQGQRNRRAPRRSRAPTTSRLVSSFTRSGRSSRTEPVTGRT